MRLRRPYAAVLTAAALVLVAACSSGPAGSSSTDRSDAATTTEKGAFPVTIRDGLGSVTLTAAPKRVATVGWADEDNALALGVVPVGATKITYGGNANGSTDWFDAALDEVGGRQPTRYDDSDGVPFDDIAKLTPDLILATSSGLSSGDYAKLSKIAPVVAWRNAPFGTSWQDQATMIGQALGRPARAKRLVASTEAQIASFKQAHPALAGTSGAVAYFDAKDTSQIGFYTTHDLRPQILTQLGMTTPSVVQKLSAGNQEFYKTISAERAPSVDADVIVTYDDPQGTKQAVESDKLFSRIPTVRSGATVFMADQGDSLSMSLPTVLGLPWFLRTIAPEIAAAAAKAKA